MIEMQISGVTVRNSAIGWSGRPFDHPGIKAAYSNRSQITDQPVAAFIKDLKQRGLLARVGWLAVGSEAVK